MNAANEPVRTYADIAQDCRAEPGQWFRLAYLPLEDARQAKSIAGSLRRHGLDVAVRSNVTDESGNLVVGVWVRHPELASAP